MRKPEIVPVTANLQAALGSIGALLLCSACISMQVGSGSTRPTAYDVATPGAGWAIESSKGPTRRFRSLATGSVLGVSEACDGPADQSFDALLASVTSAIPRHKGNIASQELAGTMLPARFDDVQGEVDAVPVEMLAIVLKSSVCVYDVTLVGRRLSDDDQTVARRVAQSLHELGPT